MSDVIASPAGNNRICGRCYNYVKCGERRYAGILKRFAGQGIGATGGNIVKELIEWLITVEGRAARCYTAAAARFEDNEELSYFLRRLAEDEVWHHRVLERALDLYSTEDLPASGIALDHALKTKVEKALIEAERGIEENTLTNEMLLECIVDAEYSEWNDIFLYVIKSLKESHREFEGAASVIQRHKKKMVRYLKSVPAGRIHIERIERLPDVWKETVLVVEDDTFLRMLFADVLSSLAAVKTAANGSEGLDKVTAGHFDVIVSDVRMPVMDGIALFRQTLQRDPDMKGRFLFLTGNPTERQVSFFQENGVRYLLKPVSLPELEDAVKDILDGTTHPPSTSGGA